jgi:dihydrodipicolinate synthase/N-acetylneuraminate lyase
MSEHDVMGPVDFVLLEFQSDKLDGSAGAAMAELVDRGIVSILDLLVIQKEADGSFTGIEITDLTADDLGGIAVFVGARSGLLGDDDLADAAQALEPGTTGAVIVYENTWARPFVAAAQRAGAQLVASARIPADVVNEVLDALEATTD